MNNKYYPKVNISNVGISNINLPETISFFTDTIKKKGKIRVCVTPVNCLVWAQETEKLRRLYNSADLTLCDGMPLIWFSKFLNDPLKGRVTGLDLLPQFAEVCSKEGFSIFLLGAKEGVGQKLKEKFEKDFPGIKVKGVYSPPFAERFSEEENRKMIDMVNEVKPDILFVSLTAPKQDYWIEEHFKQLDTHIAIGVGGAFEVSAGLIKRSPRFMQKVGLEWLYRFASEPRRLFNRYFVEAPRIFPLVLKQKLQKRPTRS